VVRAREGESARRSIKVEVQSVKIGIDLQPIFQNGVGNKMFLANMTNKRKGYKTKLNANK